MLYMYIQYGTIHYSLPRIYIDQLFTAAIFALLELFSDCTWNLRFLFLRKAFANWQCRSLRALLFGLPFSNPCIK